MSGRDQNPPPTLARFTLTHEDLQRLAEMPGGIAHLKKMRAGVQEVHDQMAEMARANLAESERAMRMLDLVLDGGLKA